MKRDPGYSDETSKFAYNYQDQVNEVVDNLLNTIDQAGGSIHTSSLLNRTVLELLVHTCATNGIRFYCTSSHFLMPRRKIHWKPLKG